MKNSIKKMIGVMLSIVMLWGVFTAFPITAGAAGGGQDNAVLLGDADGDGEITVLDATAIQRHLASLPTNKNIGKPIA